MGRHELQELDDFGELELQKRTYQVLWTRQDVMIIWHIYYGSYLHAACTGRHTDIELYLWSCKV